jgi:flagellar basal-body rod protein FlgB
MSLADIPLFSMLRGRLGYLSEQQKVVAQNIANAETPKYTAQDLKPFSFQSHMQAQAPVMMTVSQPGHMTPKSQRSGLGAVYKATRTPDSETTLNGNTVVLEEEMIKMSDARMNYDAAITFYQKSMSLLRMATRAPGR